MAEDHCGICGTRNDPNLQWKMKLWDWFNEETAFEATICEKCYRSVAVMLNHFKSRVQEIRKRTDG